MPSLGSNYPHSLAWVSDAKPFMPESKQNLIDILGGIFRYYTLCELGYYPSILHPNKSNYK